MKELIRTESLTKTYILKEGFLGKTREIHALQDVNILVEENSVFSVVGESGSGKSTLARVILRLTEPTAGRIFFYGRDISQFSKKEELEFRRSVQVVFQDPFASLNPRMNVLSTLSEPLKIHGVCKGKKELKDHVVALLEMVGLKAEHIGRYPHEFSGGQRQRICIARALALEPKLIIADEPLSALDVSIQAQILNLLGELKEKKNLSFLFISHDLYVVNYFSDYVVVMYRGRIMEEGRTEEVFNKPLHPYTRTLIEAIPKIKRRSTSKRYAIYRKESPGGCEFYSRCPKPLDICAKEMPLIREKGTRKVACFRYD